MAIAIVDVLLLESDGAAQNEDWTANRPLRIYDAIGIGATQGVTTTTVQRQALGAGAFVAVTDAMTDNVAPGTINRALSIAPAQDDVVATDVIRCAGSGVGRQAVYIKVIPRAL